MVYQPSSIYHTNKNGENGVQNLWKEYFSDLLKKRSNQKGEFFQKLKEEDNLQDKVRPLN